jgi:LytS/YehU family sensor histidine kinase
MDPAAARDMTIDLAQFFRRTLAMSRQPAIPLSDELALCEHFVAIERRRFGDGLQVSFDVPDEARDVMVPPMLLQPLLENAIKHGIRGLGGVGIVHVTVQSREGWLHVGVENPVSRDALFGADLSSTGTGTGLPNLRDRLMALHGDRARLGARRDGDVFRVEVTLPAVPRSESADRMTETTTP